VVIALTIAGGIEVLPASLENSSAPCGFTPTSAPYRSCYWQLKMRPSSIPGVQPGITTSDS